MIVRTSCKPNLNTYFIYTSKVNIRKKKFYAQIVIYNFKFLSFFLTVSFRLILFKLMVDCCIVSVSLIKLLLFAACFSFLIGRSGPFWVGPCRGPLGVRRTGGTIPGVILPLEKLNGILIKTLLQ